MLVVDCDELLPKDCSVERRITKTETKTVLIYRVGTRLHCCIIAGWVPAFGQTFWPSSLRFSFQTTVIVARPRTATIVLSHRSASAQRAVEVSWFASATLLWVFPPSVGGSVSAPPPESLLPPPLVDPPLVSPLDTVGAGAETKLDGVVPSKLLEVGTMELGRERSSLSLRRWRWATESCRQRAQGQG